MWAAVAENPHPYRRAYICESYCRSDQYNGDFRYNLLRGAIPSRDAWYPTQELRSTLSPAYLHEPFSPLNIIASFIALHCGINLNLQFSQLASFGCTIYIFLESKCGTILQHNQSKHCQYRSSK